MIKHIEGDGGQQNQDVKVKYGCRLWEEEKETELNLKRRENGFLRKKISKKISMKDI